MKKLKERRFAGVSLDTEDLAELLIRLGYLNLPAGARLVEATVLGELGQTICLAFETDAGTRWTGRLAFQPIDLSLVPPVLDK